MHCDTRRIETNELKIGSLGIGKRVANAQQANDKTSSSNCKKEKKKTVGKCRKKENETFLQSFRTCKTFAKCTEICFRTANKLFDKLNKK